MICDFCQEELENREPCRAAMTDPSIIICYNCARITYTTLHSLIYPDSVPDDDEDEDEEDFDFNAALH